MKIFLVGFMGAGKSVIGRRLAQTMNLTFYDLDSEIETQYHMTISSIFKKFDETCFRKLERQTLLSFCEKDDFVMSCGGGTPCFFDNMEQINAFGTSIYIKLPAEELVGRIANSVKKRPLTEEKTESELAAYIKATLLIREPFYAKSKIIIDASMLDKDDLVEKIRMAVLQSKL